MEVKGYRTSDGLTLKRKVHGPSPIVYCMGLSAPSLSALLLQSLSLSMHASGAIGFQRGLCDFDMPF